MELQEGFVLSDVGGFELARKYRPRDFDEVVGQDVVIKSLERFFESNSLPHCLLLSGESGCGKTTIARIVANKLGCRDSDFVELNCAGESRGIDTVRLIAEEMVMMPIGGKVRVYLLDECHKLTQDAQSAFLKHLEDTPKHVYFILATTDPSKLVSTIITRATHFQLKPLKSKEMRSLLARISNKEGFELVDEVSDKIIEVSKGSPRRALVLLNQILNVPDVEDQLDIIQRGEDSSEVINLARLLFKDSVAWKEVASVLKKLDADPEVIRRVVLGYANSVLLSGGPKAEKAAEVIFNFRQSVFGVGMPGITLACWDTLKEVK